MSEADFKKLKALSKKCYKDQGIWFLNAFWTDMYKESKEKREEMWKYVQKFETLDLRKKKKGCELNEFDAHRVLSDFGFTKTVKEMREMLRKVDIDFNKRVSLTEFLVFHYDVDWKTLVNAPQTDEEGEKEIKKATAMLEDAQARLKTANNDAHEATKEARIAVAAAGKADTEAKAAKAAEDDATSKETVAKGREAEAKSAEAESKAAKDDAAARAAAARKSEAKAKEIEEDARTKEKEATTALTKLEEANKELFAAQDEAKKALEKVEAQEKKLADKLTKLTNKSTDKSKGTVVRNKAANELAQLKSKDPLPLKTAKITLEAAYKRVAKKGKKAQRRRGRATAAKVAMFTALKQAESKRQQAESERCDAEIAKDKATAAHKAASEARVAAEESRAKATAAKGKAVRARLEADQSKKEADAAKANAEAAQAAADASAEAAQKAFAETEAFFKEVMAKPRGSGQGSSWYVNRELAEAKKYLPKRKGGTWKSRK